MKALPAVCLILRLYMCGSFRFVRLHTRAIIHARGMTASRNESTAQSIHHGTRSYYSPAYQEEQQDTPSQSNQWSPGGVALSEGIIPTGPESLARIESKASQPMNTRPGESQHAGAAQYFKIVESLPPNDMLLRFTQTAPKHVQEAAKSAIMNILGSLPNYALDAALITTNTKLANLLYQMQMTGYMFKNAEYRMSLTRGLRGLPRLPSPTIQLPTTANATLALPLDTGTKIVGEATVRSPTGQDTTVDVEALTTALSKEIADLRQELTLVRNEREAELRANLLTYIQALPQPELMRLTADMSEEVVQAMEMLVDALMSRLGVPDRQSEVILQQSVGHLAQICMWQIVVGYKLRELEALERGVALD